MTTSSGNIPRVSFPRLQAGNVARNLYVGTASGQEALYATGITTTTYDLVAAQPANSYAVAIPTVNTTGLTYTDANKNTLKKPIELIRSAKNGNLQDVYRYLARVVTDFNEGDPMTFAATTTKVRHAHVAIAVLNQACTEMGMLIDGNPGTLNRRTTGIGGSKTVRTWP